MPFPAENAIWTMACFKTNAGSATVAIDGSAVIDLNQQREAFGFSKLLARRINFGDCMSCAIAYVEGVPLLFNGDDFRNTEIEPAYRP
jgi:uncharacterized protein with PIN domain